MVAYNEQVAGMHLFSKQGGLKLRIHGRQVNGKQVWVGKRLGLYEQD